ncbi:MAG: single-stranded DNA-binding protein [Clostridiaceae bacterium]|nr:single-stranded DNA-binding protein [Clostridiaceae bacterium]
MLNNVSLMGRLTADPELKTTPGGNAVLSITLAVERDYAPQGQNKETDFIEIVAWRNTAEFINKYFSKGQMIALTGRLQTRTWEDKQGSKRKTTEIVTEHVYFAGDKPSGGSKKPVAVDNDGEEFGELEDADDDGELPFN